MSGNQYVFYLKCHTRLPSSGTTVDLQVATAHRKSCWSLSQNLSEVIELLFFDLSALRFNALEMAVSVLLRCAAQNKNICCRCEGNEFSLIPLGFLPISLQSTCAQFSSHQRFHLLSSLPWFPLCCLKHGETHRLV